MSAAASPIPPGQSDAMLVDTANHPRKSYRRKYRKIMVKFEQRMQEGTSLFKDEQRIFDISQRLAEQTDQILELLLEVNQSPEIPSSLRYDLKPSSKTNPPKTARHQNEHAAHETLRLGRYQVQKGERSTQDYEESRKDLLDAVEFAPTRSYASLTTLNTATPAAYDENMDPSTSAGAGYMTIRQEEQHLQSLDTFIAGKSTNPRSHVANSLGNKSAERTTDREREMQLRNPVSVYNWLRKHQPQVFLQDHESNNDKGSKVSGARSSKRAAANKEVKQEQDYYDEDGIALEYSSTSRGKRKRIDDGAFRPKGGKPGHGPKKRKEDSGRRSKRSSMDARIS